MSGWRAARPEELSRLWPAARSSHIAASLAELQSYYEAGPWRVRVSNAGDAMVLDRWRAHLDALAIRGLWVAEHRVPALVKEARAVARSQDFGSLLTPLLASSLHRPYVLAGMAEMEPIIALQGQPSRIASAGEDGESDAGDACRVRAATTADIPAIEFVDSLSFDDFWRYGRSEIESILAGERVTVAADAHGVCGYASANIRLGTCTLGRLAVAPHARRRGVGRALVADAARWGAEHAAAVFSLCTQESNAASRALYRRCGLVEVDERYGILRCEV